MAIPNGDVVAFIDLGTNSLRLLVVRIASPHAYTVITQQKEMVRLGEGEFGTQHLQPAAIARAVAVCRHFAELAQSYGAKETVAVATAAAREAHNQAELLAAVREGAGVDLRVISGLEEARLIYLGIASGVHLGERMAAFIDIGGGSTEVIIGGQRQYADLESLKLGAIRLAVLYLGGAGPVSADLYDAMRRHVRDTAVRTVQRLRPYPATLAFGSSGTIENLAHVAARVLHNRRPLRHETLTRGDLGQVAALLRGLPLEERRKVPGLTPERADIIVPGAAILETLMAELGLKAIHTSERGLRDGLLQDYLAREFETPEELSVRARSVLRLAQTCGMDTEHAAHVSRLALELFDSARAAGLHTLGAWERELLGWAGHLHDIGAFLSYTNHHQHSYYIIRHADLLGFDQLELNLMAATAFFHRRAFPRKRHPEFAALDDRGQRIVRVLCVLLRLAESLDRGHNAQVASARFTAEKKTATLHLLAPHGCQLELWGVEHHADAVEKAFGRKMKVVIE